ncbi:MAG: DNA-directed RNA polymerase subunit D [Candidatus Diapherotrites archaeon]|nr:DNA-directed RNA polymerase subunit D [Candidatus Diapherotrites archaeon]
MEIKEHQTGPQYLELLVKGTDEAFLNAIRRTATTHVPTLAIENVSIYENSSVLFDEYIASRLGLTSLRADPKFLKKGDKAVILLEEEGPKMVHAKDLKPTDPSVDVAYEDAPLLKLMEGQKIKMEMEAVAGIGQDHVKWQPANVYYRHSVTLSSKKGLSELHAKIVETNKDAILEYKDRKLVLSDPNATDLSNKIRESKEIEMEFNDGSFLLCVEGFGHYATEKEVLLKAAEVLKEKTKELKKELKKL